MKLRLCKDGEHAGKVLVHWLKRAPEGETAPIRTIPNRSGAMRLPGGYFTHGCQPKATRCQTDGGQFSDDPRVVNCAECRKSVDFQAALAEQDDYE